MLALPKIQPTLFDVLLAGCRPGIALGGEIHMKAAREIRQKVREAIQAGKLPNQRPERALGGPGVGASCAICAEPVSHDQVEFKLEFAHGTNGSGVVTCHVHSRCFAAWEFERYGFQKEMTSNSDGTCPANPPTRLNGASKSSPDTGQKSNLPGGNNDGSIAGREQETAYQRGRG